MLKYYWIYIIYDILILAFLDFLTIFFRSEFIKVVDFYSIRVLYLYIFFFGFIAYTLLNPKQVMEFVWPIYTTPFSSFYLGWKRVISVRTIRIILVSLSRIVLLFLLLNLAINVPLKYLLFALLALPIGIFFLASFTLLYTIVILQFRGDALDLLHILRWILTILFPSAFAISFLPQNQRALFEILYPLAGIVEELRKLAILGKFDITILIINVLTTFTSFLVLRELAEKAWLSARKSGKIKLV